MRESRYLLLVLLVAVGLTWVFWGGLWTGGGLIGGDIYSYYFPQKVFYAERLSAGEFPFWNNRAGFGYPVLGESQTGAFYPAHLLLYTMLDVNTAYSVNHLLHYVLAFLFAVFYARRFGLGRIASLMCGLVYAYGWFPCRACWEWAIIGGAWLPAALWCVESFLQSGRWRFAGLLSLVLAVQMLAGHFQLAWITQLLLIAYVPLRIWIVLPSAGPRPGRDRLRAAALLAGAGVLGFCLAAVQLLPTWEFRQVSERAEVGVDYRKLAFGSIPTWYWSQAVLPAKWYAATVDREEMLRDSPRAFGARTNEREAQLYFGIVPLGLALVALVHGLVTGRRDVMMWLGLSLAALTYTSGKLVPLVAWLPGFDYFQGTGRYGLLVTFGVAMLSAIAIDRWFASQPAPGSSTADQRTRQPAIVAGIAAACVAYAAGTQWWLVEVAREVARKANQEGTLPFSLPDRWLVDLGLMGLVAAAAVGAVLRIGPVHDRVVGKLAAAGPRILITAIVAATVADLFLVSRLVGYTPVLDHPPIADIAESNVKREIDRFDAPARLFAPMANFPTVVGAASTPTYFTFGPVEYTRRELMMPPPSDADPLAVPDPLDAFVPQDDRQLEWLHRAGVTHVLSYRPIDPNRWPVKLRWRGIDRLMNVALQHPEPLYLYELVGGRGRVAWESPSAGNSARLGDGNYRANRVTIDVEVREAGRLVLTDLMAPGWQVTVDGKPRQADRVDGLFRGVNVKPGERRVEWTYTPPGLYVGSAVSLLALLLLAVVGHVRFRHPRALNFLDSEIGEP